MSETGREHSRALAPVENALDVLDVFEGEAQALSMNRIMAVTGIHKSAAYRLVKVLVARGYLMRDAVSATYRLGPRVVSLASRQTQELAVIERARPLLKRLSAKTGLTAQLCLLDGTDVICLLKEDVSPDAKPMKMDIRAPAYCTSPGKCLLAAMDDAQIERRFRGFKFEAYTSRTTGSTAALVSAAKRARADGYATSEGELAEGFFSAAFPVRGEGGKVVSAVSVCAPCDGKDMGSVLAALDALRECAMALSAA